MEALKNRILAFFLREVVEARMALFARGQRPGFLLAEEVGFLLEAVVAAAVAVVGWGGRRWAEVEGLLFNAFCEELSCCVGGVGAGEDVLGYVGWFWGCHFAWFAVLNMLIEGGGEGVVLVVLVW
jgi:hypothetical protein